MAVKKATSAARRGVPQKKAAPTKAAARKAAPKATAAKMTPVKSGTKPSAAKSTSTKATGTATTKPASRAGAAKVSATKPANRTGASQAGAAKVSASKPAARTGAAKVSASKPAARTGAAKVSATKPASRAAAAKVSATRSKPRPTPDSTAHTTQGSPARGAGPAGSTARSQRLRVRENEKPWTVSELATVRLELEADVARLQNEILVAELDLAGLMKDIGDGAGDDPADAGTATFEREQEISLANNAREVFEQSARALSRLLDGSYGICESCGSPIGKNRLLAFPRATLCMTCKSKQERR